MSAWEEISGRSYDGDFVGGNISLVGEHIADLCLELISLNEKMARVAVALERLAETRTVGSSA